MKATTKYALVFASLWIILKIVLFQLQLGQDSFIIGIFANLLFILLAIFLSLIELGKQRNQPVSFLTDVKASAQSAMVYAVVIAAFIFVYNSYIDPGFGEARVASIIEFEMAKVEDWDNIKSTLPADFQNMTKEEYAAKTREHFEKQYAPIRQATMSLLGLVVTGLLYAFLITFLYRKVWSKFR